MSYILIIRGKVERSEQETVVTSTPLSPDVEIYTSQKRHLTALRRHPGFTEVRSGVDTGTEWAVFSIPADEWDPAAGGIRRRNLTPAQRKAAAERLKNG